jgi:hypothetical protein
MGQIKYDGLSFEWEKKWHPEIADPELLCALHSLVSGEIRARSGSSSVVVQVEVGRFRRRWSCRKPAGIKRSKLASTD